MSRKLGHAKSVQPDNEHLMNQVWHNLVDTLRLLPSVPTKTIDSSINDTRTIDEALDKVSLLISLRKGETVPPERIQNYIPVSIITPSTPTSSAGGGAGGGVKRKRHLSHSVSPVPPPLPTAASFDSNLSSIASPAPPDRSATPNPNPNPKPKGYADQLPLESGRRVAFKPPKKGTNGAEGEDEGWILATVKRCLLQDKTRYEVADFDDTTKLFKTTIRSIILLPDPNAPPPTEIYPKNSIVLGLYPDTTSLYQATVIAAPGTNGGRADTRVNKGNYLLSFVDDGDHISEVDPRDVTRRRPTSPALHIAPFHHPTIPLADGRSNRSAPHQSFFLSITTITTAMAFRVHPMMSTYPGASFHSPLNPHNLNGPHLAMRSGGDSLGYWAHVPWEVPEPAPWKLPPAIEAAMEGRGTGVWGMTMQGGSMPFNYGWPKYGPMPLRPDLGGFVGKTNPFGRSWPHGFYKTPY